MSWLNQIKNLIRRMIGAELAVVRTHFPAVVVSYDELTNTASVQPCVKLMRVLDASQENVDMPQLDDVPVYQLGSGKCLLTVAPQAGTYGFVHVCDRELETWMDTGGIIAPSSSRRFDISDCVFYPGLYPMVVDGDNGKIASGIETDRITMRTRSQETWVSVLDDETVEIGNVSGTITVDKSGQVNISGILTVDP